MQDLLFFRGMYEHFLCRCKVKLSRLHISTPPVYYCFDKVCCTSNVGILEYKTHQVPLLTVKVSQKPSHRLFVHDGYGCIYTLNSHNLESCFSVCLEVISCSANS